MIGLGADFFGEEEDFSVAFERAFGYVFTRSDLGAGIYRSCFFNDEPKLFSYTVDLNKLVKKAKDSDDGVGSGTAMTSKRALMKALGEALERYCLCVYDKKEFVVASYEQVREKAIDIFKLKNFSSEQLKKKQFKHYLFDERSKINWVYGFSLKENKNILIPAQLVYVPYELVDEVSIRDPITTGAAASTSLGGAIYRGVCETVERDAFMITYLNSLSRETVDLDRTHKELKRMKEMAGRYNLELRVVDITTDIKIPVIMGIIIDRTGIGPAISVGLSSDLDPVIAAVGAAEEAFHTRPWIRSEMIKKSKTKSEQAKRGLYWSNPTMIDKCKFLYANDKNKVLRQKYYLRYEPKKLKEVLSVLFGEFNYDVYFVEVTTPEVQQAGFRVVKVILPDLQPLYLDEYHPYREGERLFNVPIKLGLKSDCRLNKRQHPFV